MVKLRNRALRMMQTKDNEDYVKDGLVLWLDGYSQFERIPNSSSLAYYWKDFSDQDNKAEIAEVSIKEDAVAFDDRYSVGFFGVDQPISVLNIMTGLKDRTIEIVCKLNDTENVQTIFLGSGSGTSADTYAAGLWYRPASGGMKVGNITSQLPSVVSAESVKERASYSIVYGDRDINDYVLYQNGTACAKGSVAGNMNNATYVTIGCRYASTGYSYRLNGEISCIRVYDRKLTDAEREHNLSIDRRRFDF